MGGEEIVEKRTHVEMKALPEVAASAFRRAGGSLGQEKEEEEEAHDEDNLDVGVTICDQDGNLVGGGGEKTRPFGYPERQAGINPDWLNTGPLRKKKRKG